MESKAATKVGAVVLLALMVFGGLFIYLSHLNPNTYTVKVLFEDSHNLQRQSIVRMQGVAIGEVTGVDLDQSTTPPTPVVTVAIKDKYNIPTGSQFVIITGMLISTAELDIRPARNRSYLTKDNLAVVVGAKPQSALAGLDPRLDETVQSASKLMTDLDTRLGSAATKLNTLLDNSNRLVNTSTQTLASARDIVGDPRLKQSLLVTLGNFKEASDSARLASDNLRVQLKAVLASSKGNLDILVKKLGNVLDHVDTTIDDTNTIVRKLTEQVTDPRLQNSLQETAELARTTLARFNQIASDVHEISGDPGLQSNLKNTVANLDEVTAKGRDVADKVNVLLGKLTGAKTGGPHIPHVDLRANVSEQLGPTRLRVDLDAQVALGKRQLLDFGLYDLGQTTRFNLQAGSILMSAGTPEPGHAFSSLVMRYGIHASKLGIGLDYLSPMGLGFQADLWDTNRPRLDAHALFRVNNSASIWLGADNLFRDPVPIIGLQLKD